ncbi:MAG: magnesium-translocating P-type ATPase [Pirellulales bacterium]
MPATHSRSSPEHVSRDVADAARSDPARVLESVASGPRGLTTDEAQRRLATHGANMLAAHGRESLVHVLARAVVNPLVVLLAILAGSSFVAGDPAAGILMVAMMAIGVGIRFAQESRADAAAVALRSMIRLHSTVLRDGEPREVPIEELVPGDVVHLAAGDMVPADVRMLACKDLFLTQAVLTGESFPVEKFAAAETDPDAGPLAWRCVCYLGTSVESGSAEAVVVATGRRTLLGGISATLDMPEAPTAFDSGLTRFTWLMVGLVAVMAPVVFLINGLTKGDWGGALFFALAVAVGLTPEMLPMIVAVCLSRGALEMSRRKVIVKHLDAIQNLGAMDVLCTDKTGTLTLDKIILERHCDVMLRDDLNVLTLAWLNSHFQTGLKNLLDRAILEHEHFHGLVPYEGYAKVDEIPFDFSRRLMSVVVSTPDGGRRLICKGAIESVYAKARAFELDGVVHPLDHEQIQLLSAECDRLSADGFRVLAVAFRDVEPQEAYSREDERDLVLRGYVAFLDPPKDSARGAVAALAAGGVTVKVLTGDNELVSRKICQELAIDVGQVLVGDDIDRLDDAALAEAVGPAMLMARLTPSQKRRVIETLRRKGHVVGFLGDGVNDALALREADVGISVDSAVDLARESADCILLDKDLGVLLDGIREGRRVFVNVLKYIRMGASSNFGNMFSVLAASVFLPFVPMAPVQLLANNLLYDLSQVPIPTDDVDAEQIARPRPWSIRQIASFILILGPCSSIFDCTTFAIMLLAFGWNDVAHMPLFHTGWFVESLLTQALVIHVIRTDRIPFLQSRASPALLAATTAVVLVGIWLPGSRLGRLLGFVPLPAAYWQVLAVTVVAYLVVAQVAKTLFMGRWASGREAVPRVGRPYG